MSEITRLHHSKIELALHRLRGGEGTTLLLLHGLGEASPPGVPDDFSSWSGPIHALDFTGHGQSTLPRGGGYTCEVLMADVDTALLQLESATVCGRGLGAYLALLMGAILCDGPGLTGGGAQPSGATITYPAPGALAPEIDRAPDPFVMVELARDLRPPDYAGEFARQASENSDLDPSITVCALERPEWLSAVLEVPGVEQLPLERALSLYAQI